VVNLLDRLAFALRTPPPGDVGLETIGRRTGERRVTPVCDCLEGDVFWVVAQRGRDANYVRNVEANPRVRVRAAFRARAGAKARRTSSTMTIQMSA
jgi:deazaflavin-dependent oxidoreductase (nitroreductase family)